MNNKYINTPSFTICFMSTRTFKDDVALFLETHRFKRNEDILRDIYRHNDFRIEVGNLDEPFININDNNTRHRILFSSLRDVLTIHNDISDLTFDRLMMLLERSDIEHALEKL